MSVNRRRRGCLVTFVLALILISGGALIAEFASRSLVDSVATDALRNALNADASLSATVPGRPMLPQLIRGELTDVQIEADSAQIRGVELIGLDGTATGVRIRGERGADEVTVTATMPTATVQRLLAENTGWDLAVSVQDGQLALSGETSGVPITVNLNVAAADGALTATATHATMAGAAVDVARLPLGLDGELSDLAGITDGLAAQATITDAQVVDDGLRVTLNLRDVLLDDL